MSLGAITELERHEIGACLQLFTIQCGCSVEFGKVKGEKLNWMMKDLKRKTFNCDEYTENARRCMK